MRARRALPGLAAGAIAGGGALLVSAQLLPSFAPCRAHVAVLESAACDAFSWFNLAGLVLLGAGIVAGIMVALRHVRRSSSDT